jgi:hypothetical protein
MLIKATQTNGGPVIVQTEQIIYLRKITDTATGVVMGSKGFSEFAISVDLTIPELLAHATDCTFVTGCQTGGDTVAINGRHIRYARPEGSATVFVLGSKGGEEFAVSIDRDLEDATSALETGGKIDPLDDGSQPQASEF